MKITDLSPKKLLLRLAEADMVFWLMPALIALLILGTVAQRWIGLFRALDTYFASFVFWIGPLPLPGGFTLLGLLTLILTAKFLLKSEWSWQKSGIILTHLGTLVILIGGLVTAIKAQEFYMLIPEGRETPYIYHYTERNLAIYKGQNEYARFDFDSVKNWNTADLPFEIQPVFWCENCQIERREESARFDENLTYQSMAQFMAFIKVPEETEPEANMSGVEFKISGTDQDGQYLAFDGMPKPIQLTKGENTYTLIFGKEQNTLPFSIGLVDFVKDAYAGTDMARAFHSDVVVRDEDLEWPVRIEMNKPLRYKGYTFFQSSFEQTPDTEMTI